MRFRTPLLALFAVILLAAPLSACGGDDDSGTVSSSGDERTIEIEMRDIEYARELQLPEAFIQKHW